MSVSKTVCRGSNPFTCAMCNGFIENDNRESTLHKRMIRDFILDGKRWTYEVGLYRVLYGWRVRGGRYDPDYEDFGLYYEFDLCCGDRADSVTLIYSKVLSIVDHHLESEQRDEYLSLNRMFTVKPIVNDENFVNFLQLEGNYEVVVFTQQQLADYKSQVLANISNY